MVMTVGKKKPAGVSVGKKKKTTVHKTVASNPPATKQVAPATINLTDVSEQKIIEVQSSTSSDQRMIETPA